MKIAILFVDLTISEVEKTAASNKKEAKKKKKAAEKKAADKDKSPNAKKEQPLEKSNVSKSPKSKVSSEPKSKSRNSNGIKQYDKINDKRLLRILHLTFFIFQEEFSVFCAELLRL